VQKQERKKKGKGENTK